ncbi:RNA polymerase II degradation factor 1-like [Stegastes partitus]|uniref:RNA polymerase II degradation factor 1-like n=1 Tax=Stegastes partitus TaxID=144197 RepID=A0A9Y4NJG6_9TELE|nr:PREDICTED: RNA polymerase II degradation factor 1-like [Stegastes partitus]
MDPSGKRPSGSGGSTENQHAQSPAQSKFRSAPETFSLTRCAACYNQKSSSTYRWRNNGDSSSSDEASGPEPESDAELSSSSSCNEDVLEETPERNSPVPGDDAEPGSEEQEGPSESQAEEQRMKRTNPPRAPFVKSLSLPASFSPPPSYHKRFVSTLHLKVLSYDEDAVFSVRLAEKKETKKEGGGINSLFPQPPFQWKQMGLPWQHQQPNQHQYQQQQQPPNQNRYQQRPSYQHQCQQQQPNQHQYQQQPSQQQPNQHQYQQPLNQHPYQLVPNQHQYQHQLPYYHQYQQQPAHLSQQLPH